MWRKASRSTVQNDNCVDVAGVSNIVAFRNGKDSDGPKLVISHSDSGALQERSRIFSRLAMSTATPVWRKSSRSNESGDNCVEVALISQMVALRDSKDPNGPVVGVTRRDFGCFVRALKNI